MSGREASTSPGGDARGEGTRLYLIRHAEIEPAYHGVFGGRIDMGLSARGHQQAGALAHAMKNRTVGAMYASPMQRVRQTVAPWVAENHGPSPVFMAELSEIDFGQWTGLNFAEVQERFGLDANDWLEHVEAGRVAGGETGPVLRERLGRPLRELLTRHAAESVAVVCHGGVIRVLLSLLLDLPLPKLAAFEVDYASVTEVLVTTGRTRLCLLNWTPWRP